MPFAFVKMHGLGNDFVIFDARNQNFHPSPAQIRRIADRHLGVGCDQLVVVAAAAASPQPDLAAVRVFFYNADGSPSGACGNATRAVAQQEMAARHTNQLLLQVGDQWLTASRNDSTPEAITVDMGKAQLEWQAIPLSTPTDTAQVALGLPGLPPAICVNMGNPHAVFFVADAEKAEVARWGAQIEHHPLFPQRTNVEFASILSPQQIRMRVWERGAGITRACGSGACATLVAAVRRGLIPGREAELVLDGGSLTVSWLANNHVEMTGPASFSFHGILSDAMLEGV